MEPSSSSVVPEDAAVDPPVREPSGEETAVPTIVWLDRLALVGLAIGIGLCVLPFEEGTLKYGFWLTLAFTVFHIYTSHAAPKANVPGK